MEDNDKNIKKSNDKTHVSLSLDTDISILDFKSPKKQPIEQIKLFNFKSTKCKERQKLLKINLNNSIDNKAGTSKQIEDNISHKAHMQSEPDILCEKENESKNAANGTEMAYVCPLCFKNFKDNNSKIRHMKNCASKNKVSTKKLLQAMELQKRQTAERISLGLLGAPVLQNKKHTFIRKMATNGDSELQLALALSKSLYEVEEIKNSSETEQNFITVKTTNPAENITSELQKTKKQNIMSILQIRSQEERDRLLIEKIAEILIDNETLTQRQQQLKNENERKKDNLRSNVLKKLLNFDNKLWNTAMLQSNLEDFYVTNLSPYIIPNNKKSMLMENTNESSITNKCQPTDLLSIKYDSYLDKEESSSISHTTDVTLFADIKKGNMKQSSINTLIVDWGNALNNSSSSDIIIFVNGGKHIWVHKLVFYVRCSNILLDIIPNENTAYSVKERICWADIEYHVALAFLEFIYCGVIDKYPISSNDSVAISSLGCLARRYKLKELFPYLRHEYIIFHDETSKDQKFETDEQSIQEICYNNDEQSKLVLTPQRNINTAKCCKQDLLDITTMEVSHDQLFKPSISPEKYIISDSPIDRENSISPDIFDDIDETILNHADNIKFTNIENSKDNIEYDKSSLNQCNLKNIITNELLSPLLMHKNESSTNEYMLNKPIMATSKINQIEQVSDTIADKVKQKSDLTLFIEEVQKENAKSDFEIDAEIDSPSKLFIQHNRNPFRKIEYDESIMVIDKFDDSKLCTTKAGKKVSSLSKLESDMQIHAIENPQLYNITISDNLKCTTPVNHNCTDFVSPIKEINVDIARNNKNLEKMMPSMQENNISMTSQCSNSEIDTDDADISMYTKYKKKHNDNSIAVYRSALKKHKNNLTKIQTDVLSPFNVNKGKNINIIGMEENTLNLSFSIKSRNESEICHTLINNTSQSTQSLKDIKTNNCSNGSSNDDYSNILNLHSFELSTIEKQYSSPLKSPINSDPVLISSSPDIEVNSVDNDNFKSECNKQDNYKSNEKNRLFTVTETYISPPNYDVMGTPELHKEIKKYGLKIQNRKRSIKLLTYIYNELHPTIDSCETPNASIGNIYHDDEKPPRKRQKTDAKLSNKYNNIEYEYNLSSLQSLDSDDYSKKIDITTEANVNTESLIALNDCTSVNEAFFKLINFKKDLHNPILRYEPLNLELIHCMLKIGGFKCKINALMDFLDEQCITFYLPESKTKIRTRKQVNS
ncbi:hypothetical protein KPH14_010166 [Odynerus spinipes]|uniref:Structure-specific endonuclease subunit SLX4 n=1 Tax=Odynerus spinipes TaxID=1348599 RepID=A0AAD9RTW0_9HYME|nr:hypothetical protein KPH14_010166 [Odynerus spinipes]